MKHNYKRSKNVSPLSPNQSDYVNVCRSMARDSQSERHFTLPFKHYVFNISGESKNVTIHQMEEKVSFSKEEYVTLLTSVDELQIRQLATKFFYSVSCPNNLYLDENQLRKFYRSLDTTQMSVEAIDKLVKNSMLEMDADGNQKITVEEIRQYYIKRSMRNN